MAVIVLILTIIFSYSLFHIYKNKQIKREIKKTNLEKSNYIDYVADIKEFKRKKEYISAVNLLNKCCDIIEQEAISSDTGYVYAPWYYQELAICYRKLKMQEKEVAILEKYLNYSKINHKEWFEKRLKIIKDKHWQ